MRESAVAMVVLCALTFGCVSGTVSGSGAAYRAPGDVNFRFRAYTANILDPSRDRRCYYRVFIDRIEAGRTSTGLESQFLYFDAMLSVNRHLLEVEKWVLNPRDNRYIKLNRIDQPRPGFFYFELPRDRVVVITLKTDGGGEAVYGTDYERD